MSGVTVVLVYGASLLVSAAVVAAVVASALLRRW